jgi:hypothetical protein
MRRRQKVLELPLTRLRLAGHLNPPPSDGRDTLQAVGVGPDHRVLAVWVDPRRPRRGLVTVHDGGPHPVRAVTLDDHLWPTFVQPLPGGRVLLARARTDHGPNAEIRTADGHRERVADLGHAIDEVLTTPSGDIWVSNNDDASGVPGLQRYTDTLRRAWAYPEVSESTGPFPMYGLFACPTLNVAGETAWTWAYDRGRVMISRAERRHTLRSVRDDRVVDHGKVPRSFADKWTRDRLDPAQMLILDGPTGALVGGSDYAFDLVSGFRITEDGARGAITAYGARAGASRRLVLPDGTDLYDDPAFRPATPRDIPFPRPATPPNPWTCRGPELHIVIGRTWYRTDLARLDVGPSPQSTVSCGPPGRSGPVEGAQGHHA